MMASPDNTPIHSACTAKALARAMSPAPRARLMADDTPLPMAPADSICCSMTKGNTSAMPASDGTPMLPTNAVSIMAAAALASMAAMLGSAKRSSVGRIGPVSSRCCAASAATCAAMSAATCAAMSDAGLSALSAAGADGWPGAEVKCRSRGFRG